MSRLTSDEAFRAQLTARPAEALAEYGIILPAELIPDNVQLPPAQELRDAVNRLEDQYPVSRGWFSPLWVLVTWFQGLPAPPNTQR
jgi:hypothetical protein